MLSPEANKQKTAGCMISPRCVLDLARYQRILPLERGTVSEESIHPSSSYDMPTTIIDGKTCV